MSQFISGNMHNSASFDYGEFVTIDGGKHQARFRKDLILGYAPSEHPQPAVNLLMGAGWNSVACDSYEVAKKECQKLDWIYKKDLVATPQKE